MKDGILFLQGDENIFPLVEHILIQKSSLKEKQQMQLNKVSRLYPRFLKVGKNPPEQILFAVTNDWNSATIYKTILIQRLNEDFAIKIDKSINNNFKAKITSVKLIVLKIKYGRRKSR